MRQNITLLSNALFLVLIFLTKWVVFETNDDALMMHIAAGSISGKASPFILFSNWYWGNFLVALFSVLPNLNAYTLIFFVLHIFINYTFNQKILKKGFPIIWTIIFTVFQLLIILKLQFTALAIMLGMTSILLFLDKKYVAGAVLLVVCSLIRWEAFMLVLLLWSAYIIVKAIRQQNYFQLFFFGMSIFCAFFLNFQHNQIYERQAGEYALFTPQSASSMRILLDYAGDIDEKALQSVQWTTNDYKVFKQWFWADTQVYSKEKINTLAASISFSHDFFSKVKHCIHFVVYHLGYCLVLGILCYVMRAKIFCKKNRLVLIPLLLSLLVFFLLQRFLPRVVIPMCLGVFFILLIEGRLADLVLSPQQWLTILLLLCLQVGFFVFENLKSKSQFEACQEILTKYQDKTILNVQSALNIEGCPIWKNPNTYSKYNFTFIDVLVGYPTYEKFMESHQITNSLEALYQRDGVYLCADNVSNIQEFISEHYHQKTTIDTVETKIYPDIYLFKIRKIE